MNNSLHRFKVGIKLTETFKSKINFKSDLTQEYYDSCVLMLPENYSADGKPTRLVISFHGAGGTVTTDDAQVEKQPITKYLLANGYAVMDANGLPEQLAEKENIDIRNNIGSPIAVECYVKAYNHCIENFNLQKEVFIFGGSMGGISSTNVVLSKRIPVIAQMNFCPVLDTYNQIFLKPWTGGAPKIALGKIYNLQKDDKGEYIYDESKILGYNPIGHCYVKDGKEYLSYPVPVKFWHSEDDDTVSIEPTKRFIQAIKNAGGNAHLCIYPTGKHEPQEYGEYVKEPTGNVIYKGEVIKIKPAVEDAFQWIRSFDK